MIMAPSGADRRGRCAQTGRAQAAVRWVGRERSAERFVHTPREVLLWLLLGRLLRE